MKLYYSPGACSLSPHIVLREAGIEPTLERVDLKVHKTAGGADYHSVNPKGYVPALEIEGGEILTEGPAIVQFIADKAPDKGLVPAAGTLDRVRVQEMLNFIGTELHKAFSPLFGADTPEATKQAAKDRIARRLDHFDQLLSDGRTYLFGKDFSVADAYLFTIVNWTRPTGIALDPWPNVKAYQGRVAARPAVQAALKAEGLI